MTDVQRAERLVRQAARLLKGVDVKPLQALYMALADRLEVAVRDQADCLTRATHTRAILSAADPHDVERFARAHAKAREQLARAEARAELLGEILETIKI